MPIHRISNQKDNILLLFCIIDDLCKSLLPPMSYTTGRKAKLSHSELMTIAVIFSITNQNRFNGFYQVFKLCNMFDLPEYSRLLRNIKETSYETHMIVRGSNKIYRSYFSLV